MRELGGTTKLRGNVREGAEHVGCSGAAGCVHLGVSAGAAGN